MDGLYNENSHGALEAPYAKPMINENNGGNTQMENGFGTQDIITGRGLGINGFGYPHGAGYGQFATPSANAVRMNAINDKVSGEANCSRSVLGVALDGLNSNLEGLQRDNQFTSTNTNINNGFERLCERINADSVSNRDLIFQQELRNGDRLRDLQRDLNDCCCETQKEILRLDSSNNLKFAELRTDICNVESRLTNQINASEARSVERQLNAANAELTALKTQVACGCTTGCSTPCPPCNGAS